MGKEEFAVKKRMLECVAGWVKGWPDLACQSGINSFRALGSITAPERICEPTKQHKCRFVDEYAQLRTNFRTLF